MSSIFFSIFVGGRGRGRGRGQGGGGGKLKECMDESRKRE